MVQTILQCPYAGGKAVYQARAILSMVNDTIEYFDDTVCLQSGIYRQADAQQEKALPEITIIPNPASDMVEIKLHAAGEGLCHIVFTNMLGQVVITEQMQCGQKSRRIDVSKLTAGVYAVKVYNSAISKAARLIISR